MQENNRKIYNEIISIEGSVVTIRFNDKPPEIYDLLDIVDENNNSIL